MQKQAKEESGYVKKEEIENKDKKEIGEDKQDDNKTQQKSERRNRKNTGKRGRKNESEYTKKEDAENDQKETENNEAKKQEKPNRKKRDDSWKTEIEKTMTIETKIPAYPAKEDLLELPTKTKLYRVLDDLDDEIEDLLRQIDDLHDERKRVKGAILGQNKGEWEELNHLIESAKQNTAKINAEYDKINNLQEEKKANEDKLAKLEKKAYGGRIMKEDELKNLIKSKEQTFKNSKHTATEEKKFIDEIELLKSSVPFASEAEIYRKSIKILNEKTRDLKDAIKKNLVPVRNDLNVKIKAIQEKLNLTKEKEKGKTEEEKKAEKEKKKNEYVESDKEKAIRAEADKKYAKVKELRLKKEEAKKQFEKSRDDYFNQKLEMDKIEFMWDIMDRLKEEDRKKKQEEEKVRRKEEELKKRKELIETKYEKEVSICDYLMSVIEQTKLLAKMREKPAELQNSNTFKVDENALKKENLVLMKTKKVPQELLQQQKKEAKKKGKKDQAPETKPENPDGFNLDIHTIESYDLIKVAVPQNLVELENSATAITEKKNEYLKLRSDEIAKFEANPPVLDDFEDRPRYDKYSKRGPREGNRNFRKEENQKEENKPEEESKPVEDKKPVKSKTLKYDEKMFPSIN